MRRGANRRILKQFPKLFFTDTKNGQFHNAPRYTIDHFCGYSLRFLLVFPSLIHSYRPSFAHSLLTKTSHPTRARSFLLATSLTAPACGTRPSSDCLPAIQTHQQTPDRNPRHPVTKRNAFCDPRPRYSRFYSPNKLTFLSPNAGNHTGDKKSVVGSSVSGRAVNKNRSAI